MNMYQFWKRVLDIFLSIILSVILLIPIAIIAILVRLTSKGSAIHWSKRVGLNNKIFLMPKFRSMRFDAPQIATHLVKNPESLVTPFGFFLRKTSLDELPQLWSVFKGDMSFVGPRPALFNQDDLIALRTQRNIHHLRPGITGWAQINGRDELPIPIKVNFDEEYLKKISFRFDLIILIGTIKKVLFKEGVSH